MGNYFRVQIKDGQVNALRCPDSGCGDDSQATQAQVRALVSSTLFDFYDKKLLETSLDSMSDVTLCPRKDCQCPTLIERENNMGRCPRCEFAFCIYCKASYHGVDGCKINSAEHKALLEEYLNAGPERKEALEKRYGKKQMVAMSTNFLSESYKSSNSKPCPNCSAPIEKSDGCNKMTCNR